MTLANWVKRSVQAHREQRYMQKCKDDGITEIEQPSWTWVGHTLICNDDDTPQRKHWDSIMPMNQVVANYINVKSTIVEYETDFRTLKDKEERRYLRRHINALKHQKHGIYKMLCRKHLENEKV